MTDTATAYPSRGLVAGLSLRAKIVLILLLLLGIGFFALIVQIDTNMRPDMPLRRTLFLLQIDLELMLLVMAYAVGRRARTLWKRAHSGLIGTRLQSRIIIAFCVVAIIPTIVMSLFSAYFFNYGIKTWFDTRVSQALENSLSMANAYFNEHNDAIRDDARSIADTISGKLPLIERDSEVFRMILDDQIAAHNVSEAVIFDREHVLIRSSLAFSLAFERLHEELLQGADEGKVVVIGDNTNKIQAVLKLSNAPKLYMLVSRLVDAAVLEHMKSASTSVTRYQELQRDIAILQQQFFIIFVLVALMVLLASVWMGMWLSIRMITPLAALMQATDRVRAGDYSTRVPEGHADDEIANLGRTFNRMTGQLEEQRRDLVEANRIADERRRFAEAVLSGVSAGIIALDAHLRVTLCNRTALDLLGVAQDRSITGQPIHQLLPEVTALLEQSQARPDRVASGTVVLETQHGRSTLHVQVVAERFNQFIEGFIVTFDDITQLVAAQRASAWADVARRVAHEIKNPLTPITLSADRLRKKFGSEITSDRESYDRYLDTIARHTRDIGRMVEEFVAFARVPTPNFAEENLSAIVRKIVFSEQTVHPDITYQLLLPDTPLILRCDEAQIGQILTNLLKNAAEAMEQNAQKKMVFLTLTDTDKAVILSLRDTGPGFPPAKIDTLTEPYVTTRTKGTGLGLSIVKRTMEDHGGSVTLLNHAEGGAEVILTFPKNY